MLSSTSLLEWRLAGHIPQPASGPVFLHEGNLAPGDAAAAKTAAFERPAWSAANSALAPEHVVRGIRNAQVAAGAVA